jgi:hypothetical protein
MKPEDGPMTEGERKKEKSFYFVLHNRKPGSLELCPKLETHQSSSAPSLSAEPNKSCVGERKLSGETDKGKGESEERLVGTEETNYRNSLIMPAAMYFLNSAKGY